MERVAEVVGEDDLAEVTVEEVGMVEVAEATGEGDSEEEAEEDMEAAGGDTHSVWIDSILSEFMAARRQACI